MTTETLIPQSEETLQSMQNPTQTTEVESDQSVETNTVTNLMTGQDTSAKNVDWEKRYKDLQSFQSKRENELRDKIKELESADPSFKVPSTPEQMEAFKEERPDIYNMMLSLAHEKVSEATHSTSAHSQLQEEDSAMTEFANAQAQIKASHPDFMDVVQSTNFQEWAKNQPAKVQQWIYNNPDDPDLAIIALDRYKASRNTAAPVAEVHPEKEATQEIADTDNSAAMAVGGSSTPLSKDGEKMWTASEIKKLTTQEWKQHSADIDKAYAEGRVNFKA